MNLKARAGRSGSVQAATGPAISSGALDVLTAVTSADPSAAGWQRDLASARLLRAQSLFDAGRLEESAQASADLQQTLDLLLAADSSDRASWRLNSLNAALRARLRRGRRPIAPLHAPFWGRAYEAIARVAERARATRASSNRSPPLCGAPAGARRPTASTERLRETGMGIAIALRTARCRRRQATSSASPP